jgi:hypothetical protein
MLGQRGAVEIIVVIAEEHPRPAGAPLGNVVRRSRDDETGKASHGVGYLQSQLSALSRNPLCQLGKGSPDKAGAWGIATPSMDSSGE